MEILEAAQQCRWHDGWRRFQSSTRIKRTEIETLARGETQFATQPFKTNVETSSESSEIYAENVSLDDDQNGVVLTLSLSLSLSLPFGPVHKRIDLAGGQIVSSCCHTVLRDQAKFPFAMKSIDAARDERKCKVNEVFTCRVEWKRELGVVTRRENAFNPPDSFIHVRAVI